MKHSTFTLALLFVTASGACGRGDATEQDYNDVALAVGTMVAGNMNDGEAGEMSDLVSLSQGEIPSGLTRDASGVIEGQRGTLNYSFQLTCLDASGSAQEVCDESTDEARAQVDWDGSIDWPRYDAAVERAGDWTLTNIQSGVAEFNGSGTFEVDSEFLSLDGKRMRTFQLSYAAEYQNILVELSTRAKQGGTASYDIVARRTASNRFRDVEAEFDISATVTFNADGTAILELDGSRSYQIQMANGAVSRL